MADTTPSPEAVIGAAIASRLLDVFTALPGIVESYNAAEKTITVKLAVKRAIDTEDDGVVLEEVEPIPNVPVLCFGSPKLSLRATLTKGDSVLLIFSQWAIAQWRSTGEVSDPRDLRLHGPSYPVAIPWYAPSGGPGSDDDDSIGRAGGLRAHFKDDAIEVGDGSDAVALAAKVNARLNALESAFAALETVFAAHGHAFAGGAVTPGAVPIYTPTAPSGSDVSSSNLKAD
jgi:hypothetical protein